MQTKFLSKQFMTLTILLAVIIIIGGSLPVTTKIALKDMPPFSFTFLRFVIASISILPFFLKTKPRLHKDFYKVVLFSLFMTVNVVFFPLGVRLTTATIASTLYVFGPLIVAIFSYFLLKEKLTSKKIVGVIIGFFGTLIIILLPEINKGSSFAGNLSGNLLIAIAVIATALYTVFSKRFQKEYTPIQLTSLFIFTSNIALIPLAGINIITHPHWWNALSSASLFATIYTGLLGTTLWYLLYQYAIKHASPLIASMVLYIQPVVTFILASIILGEQLTSSFLTGAALTFFGVYLTLREKNRKENLT